MRTRVFVPLAAVLVTMFAIVACERTDPEPSSGDRKCDGAVCTAACDEGKVDCGGTCANLSSDGKNCGACGNECAPSFSCVAGACLSSPCTPLQTSCAATREDGQIVPACVDPKTDAKNCGSCGNACDAASTCIEGQCKPLAVDGGTH